MIFSQEQRSVSVDTPLTIVLSQCLRGLQYGVNIANAQGGIHATIRLEDLSARVSRSGSKPKSLQQHSRVASKIASSSISGGRITSPGHKFASWVSSPRPEAKSFAASWELQRYHEPS